MSVKNSLRDLAQALGAEGEAKSIKGLLSEIAVIEGGTGDGRTVSDIISEIAEIKNPLLGMTIDFDISDSVDLFGKAASDLQEKMTCNGKKITGTLLRVEDYIGFSGDESMQHGNYIAMHCAVPDDPSATITFISRKGTRYPVDPSDGLIVLLMKNPTKLKFEISKSGSPTAIKEFDVSGLKLEKEVRPTPNE